MFDHKGEQELLMASRLGWFVLGVVTVVAVVIVGGYLFVKTGGIPMDTAAKPLPFEATIAHMALRASIAPAAKLSDPLQFDEANMVAGARQYSEHCAFCHGTPGERTPTFAAAAMFPKPPQLFVTDQMVTDDPEGVTYWKLTNGIRLSGMPAFVNTLSDTQRWQITMLVSHADKLPPATLTILAH